MEKQDIDRTRNILLEHNKTLEDATPDTYSRMRKVMLSPPQTGEEIIKSYKLLVEELVSWCDEKDSLIGHIKIFLETEENGTVWISTVGNEIIVDTSEKFPVSETNKYSEYITAIVFGIEHREIQSKIKQLKKLLGGNRHVNS